LLNLSFHKQNKSILKDEKEEEEKNMIIRDL